MLDILFTLPVKSSSKKEKKKNYIESLSSDFSSVASICFSFLSFGFKSFKALTCFSP